MASMGLVAMIFALRLGPVPITPALYPELGHAISLCFALGAALCAAGFLLSFAPGTRDGAAG
jgi:hypothetical protein